MRNTNAGIRSLVPAFAFPQGSWLKAQGTFNRCPTLTIVFFPIPFARCSADWRTP